MGIHVINSVMKKKDICIHIYIFIRLTSNKTCCSALGRCAFKYKSRDPRKDLTAPITTIAAAGWDECEDVGEIRVIPCHSCTNENARRRDRYVFPSIGHTRARRGAKIHEHSRNRRPYTVFGASAVSAPLCCVGHTVYSTTVTRGVRVAHGHNDERVDREHGVLAKKTVDLYGKLIKPTRSTEICHFCIFHYFVCIQSRFYYYTFIFFFTV